MTAFSLVGSLLVAQDMNTQETFEQMFPKGELNTAYAPYFIGRSYLAPLTSNNDLQVPMANVTFEPGCRNNWHAHTGGQLLIVTAGHGWYQERGKEPRPLKAGDVVEIPVNVEHWHGAAADSWFAHLAITCNPQTNKTTWLDPVTDQEYAQLPGATSSLWQTDPEFMERYHNFARHDVVHQGQLDVRTRYMAIMATLIGCQGLDAFKEELPLALDNGVTPVEVKEIVYQAVDYCGMGRVRPFLTVTNDVLTARGVSLPLEGQATTTLENRLEKGSQAQVVIFGNQMKDFYKSGPEERRHINRWLAENCFGDYYTRTGLDYRQREMITFCFLAAQGGCEPQLISHAKGNMRMGNDKQFLIDLVSQCLPYIGYPRSLNALSCIEEAAKAE